MPTDLETYLRETEVTNDAPLNPNRSRATHSEDFASVNWYGDYFEFTPAQRGVVAALWEAWKQGTPAVSQEALVDAAGLDGNAKLKNIFRGHPAWGTMIVPGTTKGTYRLLPTNSEKIPPERQIRR